jgi:hypothetical protein
MTGIIRSDIRHAFFRRRKMNSYDLSLHVLHKFLDTARAYLDLTRIQTARPKLERRHAARVGAAGQSKHPAIEYRENAPARWLKKPLTNQGDAEKIVRPICG